MTASIGQRNGVQGWLLSAFLLSQPGDEDLPSPLAPDVWGSPIGQACANKRFVLRVVRDV